MPDSLFLVDVSALAYRSFYAFIGRPLVNSKGEETSAVFGFASHILRLLHECKPTHIAFVKDMPKATFRHDMYEDYKAHRKPMPDSLVTQLPMIDEFVNLSGLVIAGKAGFEADDLIGTLAMDACRKGMESYIVSRDKDMMQLVCDTVYLFELGKSNQPSIRMGAKQVREKFGVGPEQVVDYLALIGDASDNVPGVSKIGPKTAVELLEAFGTLENIYANLDKVEKKGVRENLLKDKDMAFLSKQLVTLDLNVSLDFTLDDLRYRGLQAEAVRGFLRDKDLHSLLRYLPALGFGGGAGGAGASGAGSAGVAAGGAGAGPGAGNGSGPEKPKDIVSAEPENLFGSDRFPAGTVGPGGGAGGPGSKAGGGAGALGGSAGAGAGLNAGGGTGAEGSDGAGEALLRELSASEAHPVAYELVDTEEDLAALAEDLAGADTIALDTETTSLDNRKAEIVGLCLSIRSHHGYYIPIAHAEGRNLPLLRVRAGLAPVFEDESKRYIFHNAKYDLPVLQRAGLLPKPLLRLGESPITLPLAADGPLIDTLVAAYLANPGARNLSLDDLADRLFDHKMIPIESLIGKGKGRARATKPKAGAAGPEGAERSALMLETSALGGPGGKGPEPQGLEAKGSEGKGAGQKSFAEVPIGDACRYGAEDADITYRLWRYYERELVEKNLLPLLHGLEAPLIPVLTEMEREGITIDSSAMQALSEKLKGDLARLEEEIYALAGTRFNVGSPTQLSEVLFVKLRLKAGKKTKTGYSTDADVLQKLEGSHPIIGKLLEHRESAKLKSTYVDALPQMVDPVTGRVHTTYSQVIAATGRLSSVNPNLQNIPIRTEQGRYIRNCFIAKDDRHVLLSADYSQIELRFLAHLTRDPRLVEAYRKGIDIHARTAAALYKVPEGEVTGDMRRSAKVVNFGVLYGMGAQRLSGQLRIPKAEASRFIDNYFETYAGVERYINETIEFGRRHGYVETITGRKRFLPDLHSDNRMIRENAERIAANTPIQGSSADLIKIAMIRIHRRLEGEGLPCAMLLQVHDELVFEVKKEAAEEAGALIKEEMEGAMALSVPLQVEVGFGHSWLEAH